MRTVMQNGLPVVEPLAAALTPLCLAAVLPLAPAPTVPVVPVAVEPPPAEPLPVLPGSVAPGAELDPPTGAEPDVSGACDELWLEPVNSPPIAPFADEDGRDGATTTSTICASTSAAKGA